MMTKDLPDSLVSTDWLDEHRDDPDLRLFECTTYLAYLPPGQDAPYRVVSGRSDYEQGHIKGAGFLESESSAIHGAPGRSVGACVRTPWHRRRVPCGALLPWPQRMGNPCVVATANYWL